MTPPVVHELSALGTVASFSYVCHSLERYSLSDRPRLSSLLVIFLSGLFCLGASHALKWLPAADGRSFAASRDGQPGLLASPESDGLWKQAGSHVTARTGRYSLPILVACIVIRLEILNYVNYNQQCSSFGVESWLCLLLIGHDIITQHRNWSVPVTDNTDDPWRSVFDDMRDWLSGSRAAVTLFATGALFFSTGTYVAANQTIISTYVCFAPLDSRSQVVLLQYVSLLLDAVIVILLWRVSHSTRNFKPRLQMLSKIFLTASLVISFVWITTSFLGGRSQTGLGVGPLHGFDILTDSFALATLTISLSIWACETTPVVPTAVTTLLYGLWRASKNVFSLGDWMHLSRSASLGPLWLITVGSGIFIYAHDIRSVVFVRRLLFVFFMALLLLVSTGFTFIYPLEHFEKRHPVNDLIYEARTIHDRWLVKASTSQSLATAVLVYGERHGGRPPPPKFGDWYQYASGSSIIDDFQQIDSDLDVFWSLSPKMLRKRVQSALSNPGVENITIENGKVTFSDAGDETQNKALTDLVDMIRKFSRHLPDMVLPVNLNPAPRILPSWKDTQLRSQEYLQSMAKLISQRSENTSSTENNILKSRHTEQSDPSAVSHQSRTSDFRQMQAEACPSTSRVRTSPHWEISQFCWACVKEHSRGQLLSDWVKSLDVCSQSDLGHLHSFKMRQRDISPIKELVPLFGPSKVEGFRDILIPLSQPRQDQTDDGESFLERKNTLFWRSAIVGKISNDQALRGSHKLRLLHLLKRADTRDRVTIILPVRGAKKEFKSASVPVLEANRDLSYDVGIDDFTACVGQHCDILKRMYGDDVQTGDPLENRYVLLTDEDDGPPATTMKMLRSQSLPFISTIFRTWYTERLTPWLHFVPIDPRYQGIHTTLLYFTGTARKAKMNGIDTYLTGRSSDGEWIAHQGRRWAGEALGKKDMEIYLFRLLLEWGRIIDDRREEIGFRKEQNGQFLSDEWTRTS